MSQKESRSDVSSISKVLAISSFRYLWIGQLCSQLSINMMLFILAFRIYEKTGSNVAVSGLYVAYGVPAVIFGMLAGVIVDHLDKRRVLAFCNISRALLMTVLFFFPETLWVIYSVMFVNAVLTQFYVPAEAPLIPRLVPDKYLLSANSVFSFTYFTSMASGFVLAGPVFKYAGTYGSFFILTGLYVIAVWSVSRIPNQNEKVTGLTRALQHNLGAIASRMLQDLKGGFVFVRSSRPIRNALILLTGTQIVMAMLGALGPGFADRVLHIDATDASIVILGPAVLGIILGALWLGNFGSQYKSRLLTNGGVLSGGVILIVIALLVRMQRHQEVGSILPAPLVIPVTLLLFFLLGVANSFLDVPSNATLQKETNGDMRGKIYGILTATGGGIGILPVVAGGYLADAIGVTKVLLIVGIGILLYGVAHVKDII